MTWDDWGGWFDSYQPTGPGQTGWPFHPFPNPYNIPLDANEWGFRVPLIVISPFINYGGYVSSPASSGLTARSQGAITSFIEDQFGIPSLANDDSTNGTGNLSDMFNFGNNFLYVPQNIGNYTPSSNC